MTHRSTVLACAVLLATGTALPLTSQDAAKPATARGTVFHDRDGDGLRDDGEPGLPGVRVSNGEQIVRTDATGAWSLPVDDDEVLFVIKPRGWMVALNDDLVPQGHYVHKPAGSPRTGQWRFAGVSPTGPLPASIDFALTPNDEPEDFGMVVFGDPQPRNLEEVAYCAHDVLDRMDTLGSSVGIALGDIAFDDLDTLEPLNAAIAGLGLPFFYVYGNHDMNFWATDDEFADETWERIYGPTNYSFDFGPAHFVVLDNVLFQPRTADDGTPRRGGYVGTFDDEALGFLRADLAEVPHDQLVVVCFHIHLDDRNMNVEEFLACLKDHPNNFSMSAHTHVHRYLFFDETKGNPAGHAPHVHINHGTLCGSWFRGQPGENGVPHTAMRDGGPNGWGVLSVTGRTWKHGYYGAGMPLDEQMRITAPGEVGRSGSAGVEVVANVFNGSARSRVEMRVRGLGDGGWLEMEQVEREDPVYAALVETEKQLEEALKAQGKRLPWIPLPGPQPSTHLWAGRIPAALPVGTHRIEVRATDMFGQVHRGERTIRVTADSGVVETSAGRSGGSGD